MVTGTFPICGTKALVLFDPRSSHSFVSPHFVLKLDRFCSNMEESLIVTTPLEEIFMAECVYKSCVARIRDKDTFVDLVLLLTLKFDVILGMDWLTSCFPKVNYYYHLVKFKFQGESSFVIYRHGSLVSMEVVLDAIARPMPRQEG